MASWLAALDEVEPRQVQIDIQSGDVPAASSMSQPEREQLVIAVVRSSSTTGQSSSSEADSASAKMIPAPIFRSPSDVCHTPTEAT